MYEVLNIPKNEAAADFYIHYRSCKYIVIEEGKKNKRIEKVIEQIRNSVNHIKHLGKRVDFIAFVYDQLNDQDSKNFSCKHNILWATIPTRAGPVEVGGLQLRCYQKSEIQRRRRNKDIGGY